MSWFTNAANEQEAAKDRYCMFLAVDFDFPSGHQRLWTGIGDLVIGSNSFVGVGMLARVSYPPETLALTSERKEYQLAGDPVDPALVSESDINASFGRSVVEQFGFLNPETSVLNNPLETNSVGYISSISRTDGSNPTITVNVEDEAVMLQQSDGFRYTSEHQQRIYPGDMGFAEMPRIELSVYLWGGRLVVQTSAGGGNGIRDNFRVYEP